MGNKTTIHVYSENQYVGNIMYTRRIPLFTEDGLADEIVRHFPFLKGKRWCLVFS